MYILIFILPLNHNSHTQCWTISTNKSGNGEQHKRSLVMNQLSKWSTRFLRLFSFFHASSSQNEWHPRPLLPSVTTYYRVCAFRVDNISSSSSSLSSSAPMRFLFWEWYDDFLFSSSCLFSVYFSIYYTCETHYYTLSPFLHIHFSSLSHFRP